MQSTTHAHLVRLSSIAAESTVAAMARLALVTLDVTNTCIRVVKSVGYHYVSYLTYSESCLCTN